VVENAIVGSRTTIGAKCSVIGSIVGDDAELGNECELHNLAVVGPGASLGAGNVLDHGLRIGAGQKIPERAMRFS
jgi:UDP-3-O-[3-hydroxymyristoyl] glucosamine N-acyltransferase